MKTLLALFVAVISLQICSGQQQYNPPVRWLSGTTAANSGDCNAVGLGAIYEQTGNPASIPTRVSVCVQTGASAYAWQPIAYKVQSSAPATCNTGEVYFNSTATAGSNWFGCTSSNTWTLLGGGGSGTVTVVGAGSLTSTALVTGGGSQTIQTPSAGATLDSSGNMVVTSLASGASPPACTAGTSGVICLKEGTAPTGAASAAELYTLTDHFLYTKLNNGSQDKVCTLSVGCGASLPYTAAQQNTGPLTAVPATDVTIYSFTNVPALAAGGSSGACHTIYYIAGGNTAGSGYKIKVDGTTILDSSANQLGAGANNYEMAWFRYCNNAGVRNAQTATFIGGGYTTAGLSAASAGFIQSNFYNGLQLAPTAVDWSTSHTITLTGVAASGNLIGALMTIDY